ncbi:MAG: HlyC/CorC family transporter [Chloroflexi bacterium CFX4]|nr:HlyC/CorC family transporter [Chloroflexi bacterium CFX4]MDL1924271.1 HlyC/CorC family transporter [Chloroflexi bacterium CFX3]
MGELLIILLLIIANGVFAMSETALLSSRKARLQQRANGGDARAAAALELANKPNTFLATVQIGITLIGILAGAFGGATLAGSLADILRGVPFLAPSAEAIAFTLIVLLITYLSLIIGELVPKQLALNNPERIVSLVAAPMSILSRLTAPLVRLLDGSTSLVLRLLNVRPSDEPAVTEEEIKVMIAQGAQTGTFEEVERELVDGVFSLADVRVDALMTPRTEVTWFEVNEPIESVRQKIVESGKSRFPVARGSLDDVIGVVRAKDLLARALEGLPFDLTASLQPPLFVPESLTALRMLNQFRDANTHIALIIDEYGGLRGVVTIADILAEIVGGIYLEEEAVEPDVVQREDGSWLIDGMFMVDDLEAMFPMLTLPAESEREYQTLGGYLMSQFGRIPQMGDLHEADGLRFEVVDMDGYRVDRVLVAKIPPPQDAETADSTTA